MTLSKYKNQKVKHPEFGIFASKKEFEHFLLLKQREKQGEIKDLQRQVSFRINVNDQYIGRYTPDFVYFDVKKNRFIAHETKGYKTRDYVLRAKLFKAIYTKYIFVES